MSIELADLAVRLADEKKDLIHVLGRWELRYQQLEMESEKLKRAVRAFKGNEITANKFVMFELV